MKKEIVKGKTRYNLEIELNIFCGKRFKRKGIKRISFIYNRGTRTNNTF